MTEVRVELKRSLGTLEATMMGIGAMIGAGIFVLTGIAAGEAGPAAIIAFALNGVVTLFTAMSYAELSSSIPEAGGGFSYVKYAFPRYMAFLSGWMLWFAYTVACSLYALGFGSYVVEMFDLSPVFISGELLVKLVAIGISIFFVTVNTVGSEATGKAENVITGIKIAILFVFILAGINAIMRNPENMISNFKPFFPRGFHGVITAMGLTFIAFEGYDLIATAAEEIKSPEKTIPRAIFLSLLVTVSIYLLVVFTSIGGIEYGGNSWMFLGEKKELAVIEAAKMFMGGVGILIMGFGGLFSTTSALNATILASSRVAFTMGRDRFLPGFFSNVSRKTRTPVLSILATSAIFIIVALFFPISQVASASSLFFLLTFALVNASLIKLRYSGSLKDKRFRSPLFPLFPVMGVILNIYLAISLYSFEPVAWKAGAVWIFLGLIYYSVYRGKTEMESMREMEKVKEKETGVVLLPIANLKNRNLIDYAAMVSKALNSRLYILNVLTLPWVASFEMAKPFIRERRDEVRDVMEYLRKKDVSVEAEVAVSHDVVRTILDTCAELKPSLMILGWRGKKRSQFFLGSTIDPVVDEAETDIMIARMEDNPASIRNVLVLYGSGPHIKKGVEIIRQMAEKFGLNLTFFRVMEKPDGEDEVRKVSEKISESGVPSGVKIAYGKNVLREILIEARNHDMLIMGASEEPFYRRKLFGALAMNVAEKSPVPVVLVRSSVHPSLKRSGIVKFISSVRDRLKRQS